jgi:hypothetical protein
MDSKDPIEITKHGTSYNEKRDIQEMYPVSHYNMRGPGVIRGLWLFQFLDYIFLGGYKLCMSIRFTF